MNEFQHTSVLVEEVLDYLAVAKNKNYIDCTVGGGGHAEAILKQTGPDGRLLGLDLDPRAIAAASSRLKKYGARVTLRQENYKQITKIKNDGNAPDPVNGLLLDLGLSSAQLDTAGRGFSFHDQGDLDMRFDPEGEDSAADLIRHSTEETLGTVLRQYGEERQWKKVARALIKLRDQTKGQFSTLEVTRSIESILPAGKSRIHPATRTFQALRIAVNGELDNLQRFLPEVLNSFGSETRLVIISFHSLEDRIVKHFFQQQAKDCVCPLELPICQCGGQQARLKILTKKPIRPSEQEIAANPRSRSAILRAAQIL